MIDNIKILEKTEAPRICMICMDNNGEEDESEQILGLIVNNNPNVATFHSVHKTCMDKLIIAHSAFKNKEDESD